MNEAATNGPGEDKRLVEYRAHVRLENSVGSLRVFFGGIGLLVLLLYALAALLDGTESGLFAGSAGEIAARFGKTAFFTVCLWGLFPAWRDYSDENGKECLRRKQTLALIEADPNWWRKRDEKKQQWKKEQEEIEAKLAAMGIHPDPEYWTKALERSRESLAELTRKLEGTKPQGKEKP